jgi:hypothetical protein
METNLDFQADLSQNKGRKQEKGKKDRKSTSSSAGPRRHDPPSKKA